MIPFKVNNQSANLYSEKDLQELLPKLMAALSATQAQLDSIKSKLGIGSIASTNKNGDENTFLNGKGEFKEIKGGSDVPDADDSTKGIMKLYSYYDGNNYDGAMSQRAVKELLKDTVDELSQFDPNKPKLLKLYNDINYKGSDKGLNWEDDGAITPWAISQLICTLLSPNENMPGIMKLYGSLDDGNFDGTVTQEGIKNAFDEMRDPNTKAAYSAERLSSLRKIYVQLEYPEQTKTDFEGNEIELGVDGVLQEQNGGTGVTDLSTLFVGFSNGIVAYVLGDVNILELNTVGTYRLAHATNYPPGASSFGILFVLGEKYEDDDRRHVYKKIYISENQIFIFTGTMQGGSYIWYKFTGEKVS